MSTLALQRWSCTSKLKNCICTTYSMPQQQISHDAARTINLPVTDPFLDAPTLLQSPHPAAKAERRGLNARMDPSFLWSGNACLSLLCSADVRQ